MDISNATTVNEISEYVQEYARHYSNAPKKKYAVKHPHQYGAKSVFSDDTWDLVVQLCKIYGVPVKG